MSAKKNSPARRRPAGTVNLAYEHFLKQLKLAGMGLEKCAAELDRNLYFNLDSDDIVREVAADYSLQALTAKAFTAIAQFRLFVRSAENRKHALSVECTYSVHFHLRKSFSEQQVSQFVETELRLITWPYFRQFINDLTARMAISPLLVPLSEPE